MPNFFLSAAQKLALFSPLFFATYFLRFSVAGVPLTALELFVYVLFICWFLALITKKIKWESTLDTNRYILLAFLLIIGATLGVLITPSTILLPSNELLDAKRVALGVWKGWVVAPVLYFVVLTQLFKDRASIMKLIRMYIYSAVIVSLVAYVLAVFAEGLTYDLRLSGFYESANYLALYLAPAIMYNIYYVIHEKRTKIQRYIDLATLTVLIHALFFTQSYAAILAIFGALVLHALYMGIKYHGGLRKAIVAVSILVATFVIIIATQWQSAKFQQFLDFENRSSTSVRLEIYEASAKMIQESPLAGHGLGIYQARYQTDGRRLLDRIPMEWNIPHPHNIFLAFWLSTGLLGLAALIGLVMLAHQKYTYGLLALWVTLIHGLFDTPFWKNDLAMIFWLIIASILVLQQAKPQKRASTTSKKPASRAKSKPAARAKKSAPKRKSTAKK